MRQLLTDSIYYFKLLYNLYIYRVTSNYKTQYVLVVFLLQKLVPSNSNRNIGLIKFFRNKTRYVKKFLSTRRNYRNKYYINIKQVLYIYKLSSCKKIHKESIF